MPAGIARKIIVFAALAGMASAAPAAVDIDALWRFDDPAGTEARFREALATAQGDDALILETQIARTYGLRRDFATATQILDAMEPRLAQAGAEPRVRHALERGRSLVSATHPPEMLTDATRAAARAAYARAIDLARAAGLDGLRVDALHMMAFVETAPEDQMRWTREALAVSDASTQPAARRWEASLRNNLGVALHDLGRYDEALAEFQRALALREVRGDAASIRIAHWMIAWTWRAMGRLDEAIALQQRLEREWDAAGAPDPEVYEELERLYRAKGDAARADAYAAKRAAVAPPR